MGQSRVSFSKKITGPQVIKEIPAFYGTRRFITAFTRAQQSHFLNIHFNIILSSLRSSKWSLSLRFPLQNPVCTSLLPSTYYCTSKPSMHLSPPQYLLRAPPSHFSLVDHQKNIWWRVLAGIVGSNPARCMDVSLVSVMCYQLQVSASGWSLVQRSPTDCGVSECDSESSIMRRPWPTVAAAPW